VEKRKDGKQKSCGNVAKFKHLGTKLTNRNCINDKFDVILTVHRR